MNIIIIGAGIAGLSLGWRLLQKGAQVTILERGQAGHGASWAAAGMIAPQGEIEYGAEAIFSNRSSLLWPSFAADLETASGASVHYRQNGALLVAMNDTDANILSQRALQDSELELLNASQALEKVPHLSPTISGALWAGGEAQVNNRALIQILISLFERYGGRLERNEPVQQFNLQHNRITSLQTSLRTWRADAYVIAAGAWSSAISGLPENSLPTIQPVKGEIIAMAPPQGEALPEHVIWGNEVYLVPRQDYLMIGATVSESGFDTRPSPAARQHLYSHAQALYPSLNDWTLLDHWAGLRPRSQDGLPIIGQTRIDGLYFMGGQYRNGILYAPALADAMTQCLLDGTLPPDCQSFDIKRFHG